MRFSPDELAEPAADLMYRPNKLHGDEIQTAGGTTFEPRQPYEWLRSDEVEELIRRLPAIELLLVDDTVGYPPQVFRITGLAMTAWTKRLSGLYSSDDGRPDPRIGWSLDAYRWTTADDREALVFRFNC